MGELTEISGLSDPDMLCKVSQGVTTVVGGNCGISLAPLKGIEPVPPLNLLGGQDWYRFDCVAEYMDEVDRTVPASALPAPSTFRWMTAIWSESSRSTTP